MQGVVLQMVEIWLNTVYMQCNNVCVTNKDMILNIIAILQLNTNSMHWFHSAEIYIDVCCEDIYHSVMSGQFLASWAHATFAILYNHNQMWLVFKS